MKIFSLLLLVLIGGSAFAQQQPKDSIVYEYKPRYYLNQDSTKVKEFIKKTIEEQEKLKERQKPRTKHTYYWNTELACRYEKPKALLNARL